MITKAGHIRGVCEVAVFHTSATWGQSVPTFQLLTQASINGMVSNSLPRTLLPLKHFLSLTVGKSGRWSNTRQFSSVPHKNLFVHDFKIRSYIPSASRSIKRFISSLHLINTSI